MSVLQTVEIIEHELDDPENIEGELIIAILSMLCPGETNSNFYFITHRGRSGTGAVD